MTGRLKKIDNKILLWFEVLFIEEVAKLPPFEIELALLWKH